MKAPTAPAGQPTGQDLLVMGSGGTSAAVEVDIDHHPALEAEVVAAIEAILVWSRQALSGLIGLGELTRYLDTAGPLELVAPRLHCELERTEAALAELPQLLDRLRRATGLGDSGR